MYVKARSAVLRQFQPHAGKLDRRGALYAAVIPNLGRVQQLHRSTVHKIGISECDGHGAACLAEPTADASLRRMLDSPAVLILLVPKVWAREWLVLE